MSLRDYLDGAGLGQFLSAIEGTRFRNSSRPLLLNNVAILSLVSKAVTFASSEKCSLFRFPELGISNVHQLAQLAARDFPSIGVSPLDYFTVIVS